MSKKNTEFNDDFFNDNEEISDAEREPLLPPESGKKKAPRSRVLLLLLLLVAIGAGGYLFLLAPGEEPPPPPPAPVKKPIPVPVKPPAPPVAAENKEAVPATPAPQTAAEKKEIAPAVAQPAASVNPVVPAQETSVAAAPQEAAVPVKAEVSPAPAVKFEIEVGAYLLKENRLAAEKAVRRLGYEPQISSVRQPVEMVRLRLGGEYSPMEAEARLRELAAVAPSAFAVPQGGQMHLYAGSFYLLDQARVFADRLYNEGIEVEEETASVIMPLSVVSIGGFTDQGEADAALQKLKAAGYQPALVSRT